MSVTDRNRRRIDRMSTWISHAEKTSGKNEDHIRFLFYWIAYEAAHQTYRTGDSEVRDWTERARLHSELARHDKGRLQRILCAQKGDVVRIFELRQAHPSFWYPPSSRKESRENAGVGTAESWESVFRKRVGAMRKRLDEAVRSGVKEAISTTLSDLFRNLSVVRNQIVHGASAGPESRGRTQVVLGARLLSAFVPCFRDGIKANLQEDWGDPPFPRVGAAPDEKCPPPWLS